MSCNTCVQLVTAAAVLLQWVCGEGRWGGKEPLAGGNMYMLLCLTLLRALLAASCACVDHVCCT